MRLMNNECFDIILTTYNYPNESIDFLINNCCTEIERFVYGNIIKAKKINYTHKIGQFLMIKLIYVCITLMKEEIFPKNWYDLLVLRNKVVFHVLNKISEKLVVNYLENFDSIDRTIWIDYFECLVLIATDVCLKKENFTNSKRFVEANQIEDLRIKVANEIKRMWYNLGDKKIKFIPDLVSPFISISMLPIVEIQNAIIPLIFDMINCEYINKGCKIDFNEFLVPKLIITTIDEILEYETKDIESTFRNSFEKM